MNANTRRTSSIKLMQDMRFSQWCCY